MMKGRCTAFNKDYESKARPKLVVWLSGVLEKQSISVSLKKKCNFCIYFFKNSVKRSTKSPISSV